MDNREQRQQADGYKPVAPATRAWMALAAPVLRLLARLLLVSCRVTEVSGASHLDTLIASGRSGLLCCWHQRLAGCVGYLLTRQRAGLRTGFLVSPSRDGELVARVVGGLGAVVLRGSANRTGARALRDMHGVLRDGVSPVLHPDGPHGPPRQASSGGALLARITGAPMLPMAFAVDRYWQLGSWDALIVPKPFARLRVTIGAPVEIGRGDEPEAGAAELGARLDALTDAADAALGVSPRRGR